MNLLAGLILLGVLIFVHEGGHFFFAKLFGVKVETFSLGFGPKILGFKYGETEYRLSAVPLGGYVKLLGEDPDDYGLPLPPDEQARTLNAKPLWQRALILIGGPAVNLLFPLVLYFIVGMSVLFNPVFPPVVGEVYGDPSVQAGLQSGDEILSVDGVAIDEWTDMQKLVSTRPGEDIKLKVRRDGTEIELTLTPEAVPAKNALQEDIKLGFIGVVPDMDPPVVGVPSDAIAAIRAGLRTGDRIVSVNGTKMDTWHQFAALVTSSSGKELKLEISRPLSVTEREGGGEAMTLAYKVPQVNPMGGMLPPSTYVGRVEDDTDVGRVLQPGDRIAAFNGRPIRHYYQLSTMLAGVEEETFVLTYYRDTAKHNTVTRLTRQDREGPYKDLGPMYRFGAFWMVNGDETHTTTITPSRSLGEILAFPFEKTWDVATLGVKSIWMLFSGQVAFKQLGGPIMIMDVAGKAYNASWTSYLHTMALISISLGLLNLFPIPLLDGGQLTMYAIEGIRRKPLSEKFRERVNYVGLFLLLSLMVLVFKNDFERYWSSIVGFFTGA